MISTDLLLPCIKICSKMLKNLKVTDFAISLASLDTIVSKIWRIFVATEEFYIPGGLVARIAASYKLALVFMTNNFKSRGTVRHHAVGHISGMGFSWCTYCNCKQQWKLNVVDLKGKLRKFWHIVGNRWQSRNNQRKIRSIAFKLKLGLKTIYYIKNIFLNNTSSNTIWSRSVQDKIEALGSKVKEWTT